MTDSANLFDLSDDNPTPSRNRLVFDELLLISDVERKARRVKFHPQITLVRGTNQTGKSSILKGIFASLGVDPKYSDRWKPALVATLLHFRIGGARYKILRNGQFFAIFGADNEIIGIFDRVTGGLAVALSSLLNFKMQILSKSGQVITPPPVYYFLPFFVDQDMSWSKNWNSFTKLQQLSGWQTPIAEYHTGLKPNEYFNAKSQRDELQLNVQELERELRTLEVLAKKGELASTHVLFDVDIEAFKAQLDELVKEAEKLRNVENALKQKLLELHDERILKEQEIKFIDRERIESTADFEFATSELDRGRVDCPTCGTVFENSFGERLEIAKDEDRLNELAIEARGELSEIRTQIRDVQDKFSNSRVEVVRINQILQAQIEQITLATLIQNEGRKELRSLIQGKIAETAESLAGALVKIKGLNKELRSLTSKDRVDEIMRVYRNLLRTFLEELGVPGAVNVEKIRIDGEIKGTGSELPRALLAYYLAIYTVISRYSSSTLCPLVIDCPNQQDLDPENQKKVLNLLSTHRVEGEQLIIGLRDTYGIAFEGEVVTLEEEYGALSEQEFESVNAEYRPLLHAAMGL